MKNMAAHITEPLKIAFVETDVPKLRFGHVLIKPQMVGLCGTDVEMYAGRLGYIKMGQLQFPIVPGHEFFGRIVEIGEGVSHYKVGDQVTCECHLPCGKCENCRIGRYNLCKDLGKLGISNEYPGALATYVEAPAKDLHKVPDSLSPEQAVLIEPTAVAVYATDRAELKGGDKVIIFGPGPIGLLICAVSRTLGASEIVVVGTEADAPRLARALEMGASKTVVAADNKEMQKLLDFADVVFEATGQPSVVAQGLQYAKKGGTFFSIALHHRPIENFDYSQVVLREIQIRGGIGSPRIWEKAIAMLETGRMPVTRIITHTFSFHELDKALQLAYNRTENVIKTVITMDK